MTTHRVMSMAWVLVAAVAMLSGCQLHGKPHVARKAARHASAEPAAATPQANARAADSAAAAGVIAPGIVEPWGAQVELSAEEPGWIASIVVHEGDVVPAGRVLATLEDEGQRRALELAQADLAEAEAELERTERGATREELKQAQADVEASAARRDFALASAVRASRLKESGAVAETEYDRAASEAAELAALTRRAEARLQELTRGARAEDRSAARARAVAARARLELAEANLARRRVVAPSAGTVLLSRFHAGEYYTPGTGPLFVLGDLTRLQVRLEVDEIDALDVGAGASCVLYSDGEELLARGIVSRLAPKMGRRALLPESPTARADVRVREVFVEVAATAALVPGQRVWGHTPRIPGRSRT